MGKVKTMFSVKKKENPVIELLRETDKKICRRAIDNYNRQYKKLKP
ncbi:MAG: hypothetical protein ABIN94_05725 [Ferruginibacter sp.]